MSTQAHCRWTAFEDAGWITLTGSTTATGNGAIPVLRGAAALGTRTERIRLSEDPSAECTVVQSILILGETMAAPGFESTLDLEGGRARSSSTGAA